MRILHSETYEREGNDAWLIDKIQIIYEDEEFIFIHKINYQGWNGPIRETFEFVIDEYSIAEEQKRIQEYMENKCLLPEMKVPDLKEILNK